MKPKTSGTKTQATLVSRRQALSLFGVAGAAFSVACSGEASSALTSPSDAGSTGSSGTGSSACAVTPNETIGPYPSLANFVRSDIREGRAGLPVQLTITVANTNSDCAPVANATVGIWQCDSTGNYSEYGTQQTQTYLRGVQTTDANGKVTFTTIYPGWYQGRATHIHVEVSVNGRSMKVTQIAFPEDITAAVYRTGVYASKGQNPTRNSTDNVFSDGVSQELATLTGDTSNGYAAAFQVGVSL